MTTNLNKTLTAIATEADLPSGSLCAELCDDGHAVNVCYDDHGFAVLHHADSIADAESWVASKPIEYWGACR